MDKLKPCPFCGFRAFPVRACGEVQDGFKVICASCLASTGLFSTEAEASAAWNTRISFDWMCTLVMCQKWKNEHERAAILSTQNDCRQRENKELTRLLTSATQCLSALCDGDGVSNDTRLLSRELNKWVSEAMPF